MLRLVTGRVADGGVRLGQAVRKPVVFQSGTFGCRSWQRHAQVLALGSSKTWAGHRRHPLDLSALEHEITSAIGARARRASIAALNAARFVTDRVHCEPWVESTLAGRARYKTSPHIGSLAAAMFT